MDDPERLRAVEEIVRFDASARTTFDRLTRLAARTLDAPVAQVNLVSADEQISMSSTGPDEWEGARRVPIELSYCQHAVSTPGPLLVEDAREHPLFRDHPATTGSQIVAYAAVPLSLPAGLVVGTLCVVDFTPRTWSDEEIELLQSLADFAIEEIQRRGHTEWELRHLIAVLESAQDAVIGTDAEGRIRSWNPGAETMFGLPSGEVDRRSIATLALRECQDEIGGALETVQRGEAVSRFEIGCSAPGRQPLSVSVVVTPVTGLGGGLEGATWVLRDITERTEAIRHVEESEARLRALIEQSSEVISIISEDGVLVWESPAAERLLGWAPEERLGQPAFAFLHPDDLPHIQDALVRILSDKAVIRTEARLRHRDGSYRAFSVTGTNLVDDPAIRGIVVNSRDVTDLRESEARLRQGQKMEAVGRLAGGIAHDFNNVLTVITGSASMALMDLPQDSAVRQDLEEIAGAADRAASLTRQLLAFSRRQVLQPRLLDLNEVIQGLEKILSRTLGEDLDLVTSLDADPATIEADPGQIDQILMNLAVNARDAMPRGGTLSIETECVRLTEDQPSQFGYTVQPGDYVLLTVSDTGTGIPRELQGEIFEPFFTTKEPGRGTGLGLSTVYGIVKQSGGYISLHSEEGHGATFKIYLPAAAGTAVEGPGSNRQKRDSGGQTILLVEDQAPLRLLVRRILERANYTVLEAEDGVDALRVADAHDGDIHLLLTDVVMPRLSGRELAERFRESHPDIRVLFTSGYTDEAVLRHGLVRGSVALLQKPYPPARLLEKVADMLED